MKKVDIDELCRMAAKGGEQRRIRIDDLEPDIKRVLLVMINAFADRMNITVKATTESARAHVRDLYETGYLRIELDERWRGRLIVCHPDDAPQLKGPDAVTQQ